MFTCVWMWHIWNKMHSKTERSERVRDSSASCRKVPFTCECLVNVIVNEFPLNSGYVRNWISICSTAPYFLVHRILVHLVPITLHSYFFIRYALFFMQNTWYLVFCQRRGTFHLHFASVWIKWLLLPFATHSPVSQNGRHIPIDALYIQFVLRIMALISVERCKYSE